MKKLLIALGIIGFVLLMGTIGGIELGGAALGQAAGGILLSTLMMAVSYFGVDLYTMKMRRRAIMHSFYAKRAKERRTA